MIDINLIPLSLRKNGPGAGNSLAVNISKEILIGVGVGLVLLMLVIHLLLGIVWLVGMQRLSGYKAAWDKVQPDKQQLDAIHQESGELKAKILMVSDMTVNKSVPWAPKFNAISDGAPRGLWIRKMTLDKAGLTIEGSVVTKDGNAINNVGLFLSALRQDDEFMKGFVSLEVNSIQRQKNDTVEVTDFTVMAKSIDNGPEKTHRTL